MIPQNFIIISIYRMQQLEKVWFEQVCPSTQFNALYTEGWKQHFFLLHLFLFLAYNLAGLFLYSIGPTVLMWVMQDCHFFQGCFFLLEFLSRRMDKNTWRSPILKNGGWCDRNTGSFLVRNSSTKKWEVVKWGVHWYVVSNTLSLCLSRIFLKRIENVAI